jgi:hypothetical protein
MRLSLAVAAGCGQSTESISEQKHRLLSEGSIEDLLALSATLYGNARMDAGDNAGSDADDDEDDAEDGDDDEDDSDDADDADEGSKKVDDPKDARILELSKEAKKKRMRIRSQAQRIADLEAENARLKGKGTDSGKDDAGKTADDAPNPLEQENQRLKQQLVQQSLQTEFTTLTTGPQAKIKFKNPKTAFKLLDLNEVDVDDDGTFDGLEDAIAALAKSDPYLVEDGKDDGEKTPARRVGQPTGSRSKGTNPNREKLLKKYPALRR